jgi:diketogulonate reductase-like aldo/keto reductase
MQYVNLATSDKISFIGLGTMGLGGYLVADSSQNEQYVKLIAESVEYGITLLDTAESYGSGNSEELIGRALAGIRSQFFISTKISPENLTSSAVITSCNNSLQRLRTDYIDLYSIHWPNPTVPIESTMAALCDLKKQGKIRHIGVSNFSLGQLKEAQQVSTEPILASQVEYNLFDRSIEADLLPYCTGQGILTLAYSPLDQGRIAINAPILMELAQKYQKTPAQIILNWIISHPGVIAIPKASNIKHLRENAAAGGFKLAFDDCERISGCIIGQPFFVPVDKIKVVLDGQGSRQTYQTLQQALDNPLNFCPSPQTLANDMLEHNETIKAVRVRKTTDLSGRYNYDLVEGRVRYWAWVIAHGGTKEIPVLIRES